MSSASSVSTWPPQTTTWKSECRVEPFRLGGLGAGFPTNVKATLATKVRGGILVMKG